MPGACARPAATWAQTKPNGAATNTPPHAIPVTRRTRAADNRHHESYTVDSWFTPCPAPEISRQVGERVVARRPHRSGSGFSHSSALPHHWQRHRNTKQHPGMDRPSKTARDCGGKMRRTPASGLRRHRNRGTDLRAMTGRQMDAIPVCLWQSCSGEPRCARRTCHYR